MINLSSSALKIPGTMITPALATALITDKHCDHLPHHWPSNSCGKAISYALNQWSKFILYLEDGRLDIDNNGIENAIRPCELGLKNYMFFGSLEAGENNAILYTLIENCKAANLNPRDYLEYVLEHLNSQSAQELTPNKVAQAWEKKLR